MQIVVIKGINFWHTDRGKYIGKSRVDFPAAVRQPFFYRGHTYQKLNDVTGHVHPG